MDANDQFHVITKLPKIHSPDDPYEKECMVLNLTPCGVLFLSSPQAINEKSNRMRLASSPLSLLSLR